MDSTSSQAQAIPTDAASGSGPGISTGPKNRASTSGSPSREEVLDGLQHLVQLVAWYVDAEDTRVQNPNAAAVVEEAARQARIDLGWTLRREVELNVARAVDRIAKGLSRSENSDLERWRLPALQVLRLALASVQPKQTELQGVWRKFVLLRVSDTASKDGIVEHLIKAVAHKFNGKRVEAMRPLRRSVKYGMPYYRGLSPEEAIERLLRLLSRQTDAQYERSAALARATLAETRAPKQESPLKPGRAIRLSEPVDGFPLELPTEADLARVDPEFARWVKSPLI